VQTQESADFHRRSRSALLVQLILSTGKSRELRPSSGRERERGC
jgi:hypothetical protein